MVPPSPSVYYSVISGGVTLTKQVPGLSCCYFFFTLHEYLTQAEQKKRKIWKLVLTGGPCGGKTTGQARLSTFFENLGWKVYRVPETATVLLGGGVNFADLPEYAQIEFQVWLITLNPDQY